MHGLWSYFVTFFIFGYFCRILKRPGRGSSLWIFRIWLPDPHCCLLSQQVPELPPDISLPMNLCSESVSSFASSPPPLNWTPRYVYKSTLTLQRISSLLTDGETQSGDEEDEERDNRTPTPVVTSPDCPKVIVTLDGATEPVHLFSFGEVTLSSGGEFCCFHQTSFARLSENILQ